MDLSLLKFVSLIIVLSSCAQNSKTEIEKWKQEIFNTEHAFAEMAKADGIPKAFLSFAADDAVLLRNNILIKGNSEFKAYLEKSFTSRTVSLNWSPDFIDVAASGDMGYTYGKFVYTEIDSSGISQFSEGIFHTVWKRQADDTWKFVLD